VQTSTKFPENFIFRFAVWVHRSTTSDCIMDEEALRKNVGGKVLGFFY